MIDLNAKLKSETEENHNGLQNGDTLWKIQLDEETAQLRSELKNSKIELQSEIDENFFANTNRINELAEKIVNVFNLTTQLPKEDCFAKLKDEISTLRNLIGQPLSVYFCANRSEDFISGGENFLTFDSKQFLKHITTHTALF